MKVLITGRTGQVARALMAAAPAGVEVESWGREQLDLNDLDGIAPALRAWQPDCVINASAYTAVDKAETDVESAFRLNRDAVIVLGKACADIGARMLHISTDFVFDGQRSTPWAVDAPCSPLGVYGASKRAGEEGLLAVLPAADVVRTAWVYSATGQNFMNTMLRLMGERDALGVVADQVGTPTSAESLANMLWSMALSKAEGGIWHFTDAGTASWYDFACAIYRESRALGLLKRDVDIAPLTTADYPTPARRPAYSVLDCRATWQQFGQASHWQDALRRELQKIIKD